MSAHHPSPQEIGLSSDLRAAVAEHRLSGAPSKQERGASPFSASNTAPAWHSLGHSPIGPLLGIGAVALVACLDVATGAELSVSIFYVAPIAAVSWHFGRRWGWGLALLSAFAWYGADRYGGQLYTHGLIPIWNALVRLAFFAGTVEALHRLRSALLLAQELARKDMLTGLCNSRAFREAASRELAYAQRYGGPLSVAYMDVDNFKQVNDSLGHEAGDRVLTTVGQVLQHNLRQTDTPARLGGDEFAILLPQADSAAARAAMQKLKEQLAVVAKKSGWPISLSIGIATFSTPPSSVDALIGAADEMMYDAKRSGKNRIRQGP